jgi:hypothetical protein
MKVPLVDKLGDGVQAESREAFAIENRLTPCCNCEATIAAQETYTPLGPTATPPIVEQAVPNASMPLTNTGSIKPLADVEKRAILRVLSPPMAVNDPAM